MKVLMINASARWRRRAYEKNIAAPPQSIFSLAACTPPDIAIDMVDESIGMRVNFRADADIVIVFFDTPNAYHGYDIAGEFRRRGKTTVIGGGHTMRCEAEAARHANSLLVGEPEGVWRQLLQDRRDGRLKRLYMCETQFDIAALNPFPRDIISLSSYDYVWSVVVSRGSCGNIRFRPIQNIVNEIKTSGAQIVRLYSENLIANREYAKALFRSLIPLGIFWTGNAKLIMADDNALLELAAKSGLVYLQTNIEMPSTDELLDFDQGELSMESVKHRIKMMHKHKILIDAAIKLGLSDHTREIFSQAVRFVRDIELDTVRAIVSTPLPGSRFYESLDKAGKLLTKDWSKYDGRHLVFCHEHLTPEDVRKGICSFEEFANTLKGKYRRNRSVSRINTACR